jgi:hypothetical protein
MLTLLQSSDTTKISRAARPRCVSSFSFPWSTGAAAPAVFPFILGGARAPPQHEQTRSMRLGHKDDGSPVVSTRDNQTGEREPRPSALAFSTTSRSFKARCAQHSGLRPAHTPAVKCVFASSSDEARPSRRKLIR